MSDEALDFSVLEILRENIGKFLKIINENHGPVLIPANNVQEYGLQKSPLTQVKAFQEYLQKNNIPVTIRKEMGADINAACGQLRNKIEELE